MKNPKIVTGVIVAVVLIVVIAIFSFVSLDQTMGENEGSIPQLLTQQEATQSALDANNDWVLELNALGRAEAHTAVLEENTWVVRIRNYQRPEDQQGFLLVYRVDALTGEVDENTFREEVN